MERVELEKAIIDEMLLIRRSEPVHRSSYGNRTFNSGPLGSLIETYFRDHLQRNKTESSKMLKMSSGSYSRIISEKTITSEMLNRVLEFFERKIDDQIDALEELEARSEKDWRLVQAKAIQDSISKTSLALIHLLSRIQASNALGSKHSAITEVQRAQLVAMLEATLAALKAPAVQASQTEGLFSWLRSISKRGVEKGLERGVSDSLSEAISAGEELVLQLGEQPSISGLENLL